MVHFANQETVFKLMVKLKNESLQMKKPADRLPTGFLYLYKFSFYAGLMNGILTILAFSIFPRTFR